MNNIEMKYMEEYIQDNGTGEYCPYCGGEFAADDLWDENDDMIFMSGPGDWCPYCDGW